VSSPQISVVIPVYNGEEYLSHTLDSLLQQSFSNFEVLLIDDCSTDESNSILQLYMLQDSRVHVIKTDSNQGIVPKVINRFAIPRLRGQYYVYASQDDIFSQDWLERMFARASETEADAVLPDLIFYYEREPGRNHALVGVNGDRDIVLSNREAVILSLDWQIPGNALWRTQLIQKIRYADFGMHADDYSARVFFFHCNKVVFSGGTFFYRQDNPEAISKKLSWKAFDLPYMHYMLYEFLLTNEFPDKICTGELAKAVDHLFSNKQMLLDKRSQMSPDAVKKAEKELERAYYSLRRNRSALRFLRTRKGVKNILKMAAVLSSYSGFGLACKFMYNVRKARRAASILGPT